ncbi:MAG: hypothetical protein LUI87_20105 [Lachnospiraceae bacterium]|nr:hypothetical protein [Lachnospiraceae bacterium]
MSRKKEAAPKIFFDVLADYWDLKYIFEYGFPLDDAVTATLLSKSGQTTRELARLLEDSIDADDQGLVFQNCRLEPLSKYAGSTQMKKNSRRLLQNRNDHRLYAEQWFQVLYGCFGRFYDWNAAASVQKCFDANPTVFLFSDCEEKDSSCPFQRICKIREMGDIFFYMVKEREERYDKNEGWLCSDIWGEVEAAYTDVFTRGETLSLKGNDWTWRNLAKECSEFRDRKVYESFLDMLRFFAGYAPLSSLGVHFLRHMNVPDFGQDFVKIRNLPPDFGLEQEYLYRILYAKVNRRSINYGRQEFAPIRIIYRDKDMNGLPEHPYLEAVKIVDGRMEAVDGRVGEKVFLLPLYTGVYLKPGDRTLSAELPGGSVCQDDTHMVPCTVDFYWNQYTEYLRDRRENGWRNEIVQTTALQEEVEFESPYYPGVTKWKLERVSYLVREEDLPGFRLFIDSFGEFARFRKEDIADSQLGKTDAYENETLSDLPGIPESGKKGEIKEYESLLSIYNSYSLQNRLEELERAENDPLGEMALPPREAELEWLVFILNHYPNMCRVFLEDTALAALKNKAMKEMSAVGWFDENNFEYHARAADIPERVVKKYRGILTAIREKKILTYAYGSEQVRILPYAFEYDVTRHLSGRRSEPIDVMCFHLDEMRTLNIGYQKIRIKDARTQEDISFSETEKLYHILAFGIRCAAKGMETMNPDASPDHDIWARMNAVLESCWKRSPRNNDNYIRCIRKYYDNPYKNQTGTPLDLYRYKYEETQTEMKKRKLREDYEFLIRTFGYYYKMACAGSNADRPFFGKNGTIPSTSASVLENDYGKQLSISCWKYQYLLLKLFSESQFALRSSSMGDGVSSALARIEDKEIWQLICGEDIAVSNEDSEGIENEIAFFNEEFQNETVTFRLREPTAENMDLVYRLFRNYNCAGRTMKNGLCFTVTYEAFSYRKIHMLLMALGSRIEVTGPEETVKIINVRLKNKELLSK